MDQARPTAGVTVEEEPMAEVGHMWGPEGEFAAKLAAQPVVKPVVTLAAAASTGTKISASSAEVEITRRPPTATSAVARDSMDSKRAASLGLAIGA